MGELKMPKKQSSKQNKLVQNAVKLQTYTPDALTIKSSRPEFLLSGGTWDGYQLYDLYAEAHTPFEWHDDLFSFARECEITLFSTPFDSSAVELLEQLQAPPTKLRHLRSIFRIELVASRGKPLLIQQVQQHLKKFLKLYVARSAGATENPTISLHKCLPCSLGRVEVKHSQKITRKI